MDSSSRSAFARPGPAPGSTVSAASGGMSGASSATTATATTTTPSSSGPPTTSFFSPAQLFPAASSTPPSMAFSFFAAAETPTACGNLLPLDGSVEGAPAPEEPAGLRYGGGTSMLVDSLTPAQTALVRRAPSVIRAGNGDEVEVDPRFRVGATIGQGAYGVVADAVDTATGRRVAVKHIGNALAGRALARRALREVILLRCLRHENIVSFETSLPPYSRRPGSTGITIVTELMDTDLRRVIRSPQVLTHDHASFFAYQTLRALVYLHSAGVAHRDIKPANLIVNANCDLKVCDFGLARIDRRARSALGPAAASQTAPAAAAAAAPAAAAAAGRSPSTADSCGSGRAGPPAPAMSGYVQSRWYRAPELLLGDEYSGAAIDMWGFGCCLYELLARKPLFPGRNSEHQLTLILNVVGNGHEEAAAAAPSGLSEAAQRRLAEMRAGCKPASRVPFRCLLPGAPPEAVDLLDRVMRLDPSQRLTAAEAVAHPFFSHLHSINVEPTHGAPHDLAREFGFDERRDMSHAEVYSMLLAEVTRSSSPLSTAIGLQCAADACLAQSPPPPDADPLPGTARRKRPLPAGGGRGRQRPRRGHA